MKIYVKILLFVALNKYAEETIKVMYPVEGNENSFILNELVILKRLNKKFQENLVDSGIVGFINGGHAIWKHEDILIGDCTVIVYTYGQSLFPTLRQCVQSNNRKMLFWYFAQMVSAKTNIFNVRFFSKLFQCDQYCRLKVCLPCMT